MKKLFILIILSSVFISLFQSCGVILPDNRYTCCITPTAPSDSAFTNYISDFEYYYGKTTSQIPVYFSDLESGTAGICHYFRLGNGPVRWGYVEVDREFWGYATEYQKINLIFHELGHCVLGREHTPSNSVLACPVSLMDDTVISDECIALNYQAYLEEMFPNFPWGEK